MPRKIQVVFFFRLLLSVNYRSILQDFEDNLKKIRENATGDRVFFWDAGLNDEDCLRLCEALQVITQPIKQDKGFSLAAPFLGGRHVLRMLASAGYLPHLNSNSAAYSHPSFSRSFSCHSDLG